MRIIRSPGFTLAELLVALSILGVIAVFTIPKLLVIQSNGRYNAEAKEVAGFVSAAFQKAKLEGAITSASTSYDLTPYLNYVSIDDDGAVTIDAHPGWVGNAGGGADPCDAVSPCLRLHNGGKLRLNTIPFGGSTTIHLVEFNFDPDGVPSGQTTTDAPGKTVAFQLYYDGFISTRAKLRDGVGWGDGPFDPNWFYW